MDKLKFPANRGEIDLLRAVESSCVKLEKFGVDCVFLSFNNVDKASTHLFGSSVGKKFLIQFYLKMIQDFQNFCKGTYSASKESTFNQMPNFKDDSVYPSFTNDQEMVNINTNENLDNGEICSLKNDASNSNINNFLEKNLSGNITEEVTMYLECDEDTEDTAEYENIHAQETTLLHVGTSLEESISEIESSTKIIVPVVKKNWSKNARNVKIKPKFSQGSNLNKQCKDRKENKQTITEHIENNQENEGKDENVMPLKDGEILSRQTKNSQENEDKDKSVITFEDGKEIESIKENDVKINESLYCELCDKTFRRTNIFAKHVQMHKDEEESRLKKEKDVNSSESLYCELCDRSFRKSDIFAKHAQRHKNESDINKEENQLKKKGKVKSNQKYDCDFCPVSFGSRQGLFNHTMKNKHFHTCHQCCKRFTRKRILDIHNLRHINVENKETIFSCRFCEKKFSEHPELIIHLSACHEIEEKNKYFCDFCPSSYGCRKSLHYHTKKNNHFHTCDQCDKRFTTKKSLNVHYRKHVEIENNKALFCSFCEKSFIERSELTVHLSEHHQVEQSQIKSVENGMKHAESIDDSIDESHLTCDVCHLSFNSRRKLRMHVLHYKHYHSCDCCGKKFSRLAELNSHNIPKMSFKSYRSNVESFVCDVCGKILASQQTLNQHQQLHSNDKIFSCKTCGKRFISASTLKNHQSVHTDIKPWKCPTCGNSFKTKSSLMQHKRTIHSDDTRSWKKFKCKICSMKFDRESKLKTHVENVHMKLRTHVCNICGAKYASSYMVNLHISVSHLKFKRFMCEHCGMKFAQKCGLKNHEKAKHLKLKPHACKFCDKKFTLPYDMKIHEKTIHYKIREFPCKICGKEFSSKRLQRKHISLIHKHDKDVFKNFKANSSKSTATTSTIASTEIASIFQTENLSLKNTENYSQNDVDNLTINSDNRLSNDEVNLVTQGTEGPFLNNTELQFNTEHAIDVLEIILQDTSTVEN